MLDKEFLTWLKQRLVNQYKENPNVDFVRKLAAIIEATPEDQFTPNTESPSEYSAQSKNDSKRK